MNRNLFVLIAFSTTLLTPFAAAGEGLMPPVFWGETAGEVIDKPNLCHGPLTIGNGIEVHICTMSVLSRDALVSFYFVEGSYACFEVTMEATGRNDEQVLREFDGLVGRLEVEVGHPGGRDSIPDGEPRATWLTRDETIRAAVKRSGSKRLIGIVGMAGGHHKRMANLVRW